MIEGDFEIICVDEFIEELLNEERSCDTILPRILKRHVLEENGEIPPRVSVLQDLAEEEEEEAKSPEIKDKEREGEREEEEVEEHEGEEEKEEGEEEEEGEVKSRSSKSRERSKKDKSL